MMDEKRDDGDLPETPRDQDSAARVIREDMPAPGGGGLRGGGADARTGTAAPATGTSRNAPIDVPLPDQEGLGDDRAQREAERRAASADAPEPHPRSQ